MVYYTAFQLFKKIQLFFSQTVSTSIPVRQAYFGTPANHSILLDDLVCAGGESTLLDCQSSGIADTDCTHTEDAGVRCEGTGVKLVCIMCKLILHFFSCVN